MKQTYHCCLALALLLPAAGCDVSWLSVDDDHVDLAMPEVTAPIPLAARDLPKESRIGAHDIMSVEMSMRDMWRRGWPPDLVLAGENFIVGRVTKERVAAGHPFMVTSLYLEGAEPGAPPEPPDTVDPPWPRRRELALLSDKMSRTNDNRAAAEDRILLPISVTYLPAGRRIRKSDLMLIPVTKREIQENPMPEFEVLIDPEQFIGRRLRKPISFQEQFTLSDFELTDELKAYVAEQLRR